MPLLRALLALLLFQIGLRLLLRLRPQPIPYGWTWLLENPLRRRYRDPERTADLCDLRPTDTVLEGGCGSGLFTRALAQRCARLIAQDLEPRYLSQTRRRTQDLPHVETLEGDLCTLELEGVADVVVLISVLPEIPDPVRALEACVRALRPGGHIVIAQELFEPEYVPSAQIDAWARAAGLERVSRVGNAWAYLNRYRVREA